MTGVYRIRNLVNDKCYYGSSKNILKRFKRHIKELNNGDHVNDILKRAWDKYGRENFVFEVIVECTEDELFEKEQFYLDLLPEYNIGLMASGGDNLTRHPNRDEIVKKITESIKIRYSSLSKEQLKLIYGRPGESNPNWRGGTTYCECGTRINSNNKSCENCRDRSGKHNPFYGKHHTKKTKKKLSKTRKGVYKGAQNIPIIVEGVEYRSSGEASNKLELPMTTIRWRVRSKNKKYSNYYYKN